MPKFSERTGTPPHPRAVSFRLAYCSDPACGPHILSLDADDRIICETVWSPAQTLAAIHAFQSVLYEKITRKV